MTPPTSSRVLSLLLRLLRNNRNIRLLSQAPSNFLQFVLFMFSKASRKRRRQDSFKLTFETHRDVPEECDLSSVPVICASRVPTSLSIPQGSADDSIINVVEPCDDIEDRVSMESFDTRRLSGPSSHRLSLQSTRLRDRRGAFSSNSGLLSAHNPNPSTSHL